MFFVRRFLNIFYIILRASCHKVNRDIIFGSIFSFVRKYDVYISVIFV